VEHLLRDINDPSVSSLAGEAKHKLAGLRGLVAKLGEISALSSVEKPILTPEQVAGHQVMWSEDNLKDYPYLLINPITDQNGNQSVSGPVAYTRAPNIHGTTTTPAPLASPRQSNAPLHCNWASFPRHHAHAPPIRAIPASATSHPAGQAVVAAT
jgi:hypothetical protein